MAGRPQFVEVPLSIASDQAREASAPGGFAAPAQPAPAAEAGALRGPDGAPVGSAPVDEAAATGTVGGLVLAAGSGRRLGTPKALLRYQDQLLVERAVAVVRAAGCDPIVVVLGAAAEQVRGSADLAGATVVVNKAWSTGMASSLRAGLAAAAESPAQAVVLLPVDMPGLTAEAVRRVSHATGSDALVCSTYEGRRSYPVLLGRGHWSPVTTLASADVGIRAYLLARSSQVTDLACDGLAEPADIDTPDDAAQFGIALPA